MFKLCCLSCAVGEEIAKANGKCSSYHINPSHTEKVQSECCAGLQRGFSDVGETYSPNITREVDDGFIDETDEEENEDETIEKKLCLANNGCEHDCELREGRETCLCKIGFKLASNGLSCVEISNCKTGFKFNEKTQKCEGMKILFRYENILLIFRF